MRDHPAAGLDRIRRMRVAILLLALGLTAVGIAFVHSATADGKSFPSVSARGQIIKAAVALAAFFVVARVRHRVVERLAYALYATLFAVLLCLLAFKAGGFNRFVEIANGFQVQPSELMKISLVLALARYLRFRQDQYRIRGLAGPLTITIAPMVLVLLQPDLGTSLMFPAILLGMLAVAGARPRYLLVAVVIGASTLPIAYFLSEHVDIFRGYQLDRIEVWARQGADDLGEKGFQLRQSMIAIGSGGATGKGWTRGTQNTLGWLPERHTDFIFAVISEEWGFAGAAGVALAFLALVALILGVALHVRDPFGRLVLAGIAMAFAAQSAENMCMTMGLTPVTGIPLPFVSHGGSSLVSSWIALAVAFGVSGRPARVLATGDLVPDTGAPAPPVVSGTSTGLLSDRWAIR